MIKPSIVEIVAERVDLRSVGSQWRGLCPFHAERTPSFYVHEEKGFHCFGCGERGDVISFVQKIDSVSFKEAIAHLGIDGAYKPRPRANTRTHDAAALLAGWLNQQYLLLGVRLRELSRHIAIAERMPDSKLVESLSREGEILSDLHEDLQNSQYAADFLELKDSIEALTALAQLEPIPLPQFPPLTETYREYLRSLVEC